MKTKILANFQMCISVPTGLWYSFVDSAVFLIFLPSKSQERYLQSLLTIPFSLTIPYHFFAVISRKCEKWAIFDILMTITLGVNMVTRHDPTFLIYYLSSICLVYFISAFLWNSITWGPTFVLCFGLWNILLHAKDPFFT